MAQHHEFGFMTWGAMKHLMHNVPDHAVIVFDDGDGWYRYVGELIVPDYDAEDGDHEGYIAVTLEAGDPLDPRLI